MGSSRPTDRSIGEATFLPQWMKGKLNARFDCTDSTFSPPADDNFFYIRYPRQEDNSTASTTTSNEGFISINKLFGNKIELDQSATSTKLLSNENDGANFKNNHFTDFSKYHLSSQHPTRLTTKEGATAAAAAADTTSGPKIVVANSIKPKQRSDDEFRNEKTAEGSRSIVHVASQIMSSKFGKYNSSESQPPAVNNHHEMKDASPQQQQRKGSKSLPVTPIASPSGTPDSSPKSRRRQRLFQESNDRGRNGWLLSSILGQSRELITPKIAEEDEQQMDQIPAKALNRKKSISSQNLTYFGTEDKPKDGAKEVPSSSSTHLNLLQAKPSEFREMNFWSPTSM